MSAICSTRWFIADAAGWQKVIKELTGEPEVDASGKAKKDKAAVAVSLPMRAPLFKK